MSKRINLFLTATCLITLIILTGCRSSDDDDTPTISQNEAWDGAWGAAELLETDDATAPAHNAYSPQVAVSANGTAIAVWYQHDGTNYSIYANRYDGTQWTGRVLLEADDRDANNPQIAIDDQGRAIAVWTQYNGTRFDNRYNRFNGTAWEGAETLDSEELGNTQQPRIAMNGSGQAIAVWAQNDGTRDNIWARYFNGTAWSAPSQIENAASNATNARIAINDSGLAVAAWLQNDGPYWNVYGNTFNGSSWDAAGSLLDSEELGHASSPQIAISVTGQAVTVWHQNDGTRDNIWACRYTPATGWNAAETIETGTGTAQYPQVGMDATGRAIAVWQQNDGRSKIHYNIMSNGAWATAALLEDESASYARYQQIAMNPDGRAVAVWQVYRGTGVEDLMVRRFDGTSWDTAVSIEDNDLESSCSPMVSINASGQAAVVWYTDGVTDNVWANLFR